MIFLNLSNGIEWLRGSRLTPHLVRIQSTACEQKRWSRIIEDLSDDFLMYLARGEPCVVVDYSSKERPPRALWQGLPWVAYAATRRWFGHDCKVLVKMHEVRRYFAEQYTLLTPRAKAKLDYAGRFRVGDAVSLVGRWNSTTHDGDDEFHRRCFGFCGEVRRPPGMIVVPMIPLREEFTESAFDGIMQVNEEMRR